jgi:hypothetical protein
MAINDNAVVLPAKGYIYVAPTGTAAPTPTEVNNFDPTTGISGWTNIGHTARDELPVFGFDGGDTEVKGTWQNASLREVITEVATDYVTFNLHQFDEQALMLYYSVTDPGSTVGVFEVDEPATTPLERALLIVIVDGTTHLALHATKTSVRREDSIELAVDEFAFMPVRATFLKNGTDPLFVWISTDTGVNVS